MKTCQQLAEHLFDFLGGELPPWLNGEAEQHLRSCSSCVALLESYRVTVRLARQLRGRPLPLRLERRLQQLLAGGNLSQPTELTGIDHALCKDPNTSGRPQGGKGTGEAATAGG